MRKETFHAIDMDRRQGGIPKLYMRGLRVIVVAVSFVLLGNAFGLVGWQTAERDAQPVAVSTALVFDGVTVIDVQTGQHIANQRVVIVGTRIQTVGSITTVPRPARANVVDARGKYLIPGLWDMHTHSRRYTDIFYPLFIANGVTGIRDAWSEIPLDTLRLWRQEILAGVRVGPPRQLLSGAAFDQAAVCPTRGKGHICVADSADARQMVDSMKAAGADMIKTYDLHPNLYFVVAAEARRIGIPFGGHLPWRPALQPPSATMVSDSGASIVDHLDFGGMDTLCFLEMASVDRCRPVAETFQRNNTWSVLTWVRALSGWGPLSDPVVARFQEGAKAFWSGAVLNPYTQGYALRDSMNLGKSRTPNSRQGPNPIAHMDILERVGLPIMAGTDVGPPVMWKAPPGFSIHLELAMYVAEGATPLHALQMATINPAKFLHATDSLGTVASGKLADLILLDADPLVDITNTTQIRAVVANGRYYDRAALDHELAKVQALWKQKRLP